MSSVRHEQELCDGTLHAAIRAGAFRPIPTNPHWNLRLARRALLRTALEMARGLLHLHDTGLVHGDLKPHNVLLAKSHDDRRGFKAKVADFGLVRAMRERVERELAGVRVCAHGRSAGTVLRALRMESARCGVGFKWTVASNASSLACVHTTTCGTLARPCTLTSLQSHVLPQRANSVSTDSFGSPAYMVSGDHLRGVTIRHSWIACVEVEGFPGLVGRHYRSHLVLVQEINVCRITSSQC